MNLTGIILLATSAAIGANAQVLKGTSTSSIPRLRKNVMKEADRRRLQSSTITCTGIRGPSASGVNEDGYGSGCVEQDDSATCTKDSDCKTGVYNECFLDGISISPTNRCVCINPYGSNTCDGDYMAP